MPVYRTPDGRIVEEKTDVSPPGRGADEAASGLDKKTAKRKGAGTASAGPSRRPGGRYTDTTIVRRPGAATGDGETAPQTPSRSNEQTRLVGAIPKSDASEADETDPVSGWFVIIDGPGKGRDVRIGAGRNDLGRAAENRIALPFGDTRISRKAHLWITYDHLHRTFSVAPGEKSTNLAHLSGGAIDTRLLLEDGATITIGRTTLRFVAFCGDRFNWSDASD